MFKVNKSALSSAVAKTKDAASRRDIIPILQTILFDKEADNTLILRATDLDIEIAIKCEAEIEKDFQPFCIMASAIYDVVRNMPMDDITVFLSAPDVISVCSGRAKMKIPFLPSRDFPAFPEVKGAFQLTITQPATLSAHLSACLLATRDDPSRPYLCGVFFCPGEDAMNLVATDGHRLARRFFSSEHIDGDLEGIVPSIVPIATIQRMIKLMAGRDIVTLEFSQDCIRLMAGDALMTAKLVDGTFPDWRRVVPRNNNILASLSSASLKSSMQRMLAVGEPTGAIKFTIDDSILTLTKKDKMGNTSEDSFSVEARESCGAAFNARYIIDMLDGYPGHEVQMYLEKGGNSGLFKIPSNPDSLTVVMCTRT